MRLWEILVVAVGLAMDAFAVSVGKGLATKRLGLRHPLLAGAWFGAFQLLMPLVGAFLGSRFRRYIDSFDHWVAFLLLAAIGGKMVWEALHEGEGAADDAWGVQAMLVLAVATSVDAMAAGLSFAFLDVSLFTPCLLIGAVTFALSAGGVVLGRRFGDRLGGKAEAVGGVLLVLIGMKILAEHSGLI